MRHFHAIGPVDARTRPVLDELFAHAHKVVSAAVRREQLALRTNEAEQKRRDRLEKLKHLSRTCVCGYTFREHGVREPFTRDGCRGFRSVK